MEVMRPTDKKSMFSNDAAKNSLKLSERSWNVYENKGPLWNTSERSWNLIENKGAYV
jgi:hypothetical protein